MNTTANLLLFLLALLPVFALGAFGILSLLEREKRAARMAFVLAILSGVCLGLVALLPLWVRWLVLGALGGGALCLLVLFLLPVRKLGTDAGAPEKRFDERDVVFSRWRLKPGGPEYRAYYRMRPEKRAIDERTLSRPGLLSPESRFASPLHFASAQASFFLTDALRTAVDGPLAAVRVPLPPAEMTAFVKALAGYYGALQVGITELKPYHVYSHIGRGTGKYGAPIQIEHRFAIAFTVEMDHDLVATAPLAPSVMESARQYVEAARVAVQLAAALRELGYPARAHIDGNYRVIAPLVARDAGLGEIGRMGLLMTPRLGPRVRLAVVTTDAELLPDTYLPDPSVLDFCSICQKCAVNCPCQAIPAGERQQIDGVLRWRIDADACFLYWNTVGTDCGRCMAVCPYSHPDTFFHNLVRWGNARSGLFRRLALRLDDLFYGRKPARPPMPEWTGGTE
jgi:reductive dehalogenase